MTTTTIGPDDVLEAFMTHLKADVTLIAQTTDIREAWWQGDEFTYPNIRVQDNQIPVRRDNGNCHGQWFELNMSVYVFTQGPSSLINRQLMKLVARSLQNGTVSSAAIRTQLLDVDYIPPITVGPELWRGEVVVSGRLKEVT
jgi:hypothetical protein